MRSDFPLWRDCSSITISAAEDEISAAILHGDPHHSTFSKKKRHGRFQGSKLFEQLFEQIVRQCVEVGLVQGSHLSVDGSFIVANAAKESRIPREQLAEEAQVRHTMRQYLREVEDGRFIVTIL